MKNVLMAVGLFALMGFAALGLTENGETRYIEYIVQRGDTVCEVCDRYFDYQDKQYAEFLYDTLHINQLRGKYIHPGDRLYIPLYVRR